MPAKPPKNRERCHSVLKLDTGLRLAMAFIIPFVSSLSAQGQVMACDQVFSTTARNDLAPYYDIAMDRALTKSVREFSDYDGLSSKDLLYIVEKIYREEEGRRYQISDYVRLTPQERTTKDLARVIGERVTHMGLVNYFRENGILLDQSTLVSKIRTFNRAALTNYSSAVFGAIGFANGRMPIFLPEAYLKIATEDMNVLLLRGLDSKEGKEIQKKYQRNQELFRAYEHINRNYTRVALAIVFAVLWNKGDDFFKEKHDDVLKDLWTLVVAEITKKGSN
ncbi:hypothetical protein ACLVWU_16450 [Bdellovibrio sp. HCB290]|uniref:hypothetical protein n=1 Tax=Bdellovibrio sp. HCB290 TaxID=3394356 RepID=UPI0039B4BC81